MEDVTEAWRRFGDVPSAFAHVIRASGSRFVGLAGAPGSGKSTLARTVVDKVGGSALVISIDDFYYSREERSARGLARRGPPGSHDLAAMIDVLDRIKERRGPITIPRYSAELDDRVEPVTLEHIPEQVLIEGWVLGYRSEGYEDVLARLDLLVFLDVDLRVAKRRRFERETKLRAEGGGFSEEEMQRFWDEVLEPGLNRWVKHAMTDADLVLTVEASGHLRSARTNSTVVTAALGG